MKTIQTNLKKNERGKINVKIKALILFFFLSNLFTTIVIHEYIHYRQGSCQFTDRGFEDRLGWWMEEDAPNNAFAYMDILGCPTPKQANEWQPTLFNLIHIFIVSIYCGETYLKEKYQRYDIY